MPIDFLEVEAAFAEPYVLEMFYGGEYSVVGPRILQMEMGEFDHFEPLWRFLRDQGVEDVYYSRDFLILPNQIAAAYRQMDSLWTEIHRTRQFYHVDDDPFWTMRDALKRLSENGGGLLAVCD